MKWHLRSREHWVPRVAGKRDLAAILGRAFAAGVAVYNNGLRLYEDREISRWRMYDSRAATEAARLAATDALAELDRQGRRVEVWDHSQRDAIADRAAKAVEKYALHNPIPSTWPILAVEETLPSGVARPDLVVDDGRGPTPVDYKTKLTLKKEYEDREISRWRMSWQMLHYCWELQSPPCGWPPCGSQFDRLDFHYYICLVVMEPFRVQLYPFEVHPNTMAWWVQSAQTRWNGMVGEGQPTMASKHSDEYGECEYAAACFQHHLDPGRMAEDYVQLPGRTTPL